MSALARLDLDAGLLDLRGAYPVLDLTGPAPAAPTHRARHPRPAGSVPRVVALHAVAVLVPAGGSAASTSWLTAPELAAAERRGARGRPAHVTGRAAAKQAIQAHLADAGFAEPGPDRIRIDNDELGCPVVAVRGARVATRHLRVTIAHSSVVAVAASARCPTPSGDGTAVDAGRGIGIGIDVEPIEPRSSRFERLTLGAAEQALRPGTDDDRDTWLTRLWAAKEAAAKATGRGLEGRPKAFEATAVDGERLLVAGRWITTEVVAFAGIDHVVALTDADRMECTWHRS